MEWWKQASHITLCNSTKELVKEWIKASQLVSVICGVEDQIALGKPPKLDEIQNYCSNDQVADFAWLTLRISHTFTCYSTPDARSLSTEERDRVAVWTKCAITVFFFIVFVVGIIGNFLTAAVIFQTSSLHTHINYLLVNLAVSDFFLIIFGVPFDLAFLWKQSVHLSLPGYCELMSVTINLFTLASILTIVAFALERYIAICHPFTAVCVGKQRIAYLIYFLWTVALLPSLYMGLQYKQVTPDFCGYKRALNDGTGTCDYVGHSLFSFQFTFEATLVMTFAVPIVFIVFCYTRILRALSKMCHVAMPHLSLNRINESQVSHQTELCLHTKGNEPSKSHQAQKVVIKMLVIATSVFFICYLPYHVERLVVRYNQKQCDDSRLCQMLYSITGLMLYFSAMLNPVIYNVMSVRFREALVHWIRNTFFRRRYTGSSTTAQVL